MNKTAKILIPIDFSTGVQSALNLATSLARERGAELLLVHVEEPPLAYGGGEFYYGLEEPNRGALQAMLDEVVIGDPQLVVHRHLLKGSPAAAIVEFAREQAVDYIVMPTHGRTGLNRLLMGSVAEEVVRTATCPVVTVKWPVGKPTGQREQKEPSHV